MDTNPNLPSFEDFYNQVTTFHFDQKDIDFQKKMALEVGFSSWDDFLKTTFHYYLNIFDIDRLVNELGKDFQKNNKITGSVPILLNKYRNSAIFDEIAPIDEKIDTYPENEQKRFKSFNEKLVKLYTQLILEKYKNENSILELLSAVNKDFQVQFSNLNTDLESSNPIVFSIEESVLLPNLNGVIQKYVSPNFYFPEKTYLLKPLHDELVALKFIEPNDNFEKTFENEFLTTLKLKATKWCTGKTQTQLFYLLYTLGKKKSHPDGICIAKIAFRLFKFDSDPSENSLQVSLNQVINRFEDETYVSRNMKSIVEVIKKLQL